MPLSKDRIISLGTSPHLHEQSAVNFVVATLPDRDPFRLWGLLDLVDTGGRRYDLDLLIIGFHALYLIEIKSHPGCIKGDVVDWRVTFPDGGKTTLENPSRLAEHKSRVLASLLQKQMRTSGQPAPWVQHLIFASAEGVKLELEGPARNYVVTRGDFLRALQFGDYPGATVQSTRRPINRPQAVAIANALKELGLRPSQASRKVRGHVLGKLLVEHENYQDHLAHHESIAGFSTRVRTYQVAQGVTQERRNQLANAANREANHLTLLSDHPNILKLRDYLPHGPTDSPCIIFEHLEGELPLDAFLRANPELSLADKIDIVTRVGEALAYCHRKSILHRGLAPSSILVRRNPEDGKKLDVRLFNFQLAAFSESASGTMHQTSHLTAWRHSTEDVYVAPEVLEKPENAKQASDLFSLGAIAYLLLVGRPPGQTLVEREALFRRGYLSPATARDELVAVAGPVVPGDLGAEDLESVMEFATEKNPINRGDDVTFWLGHFTDALQTPDLPPSVFIDPLEAKRGDQIAPEVLVEDVLGTGSTARTLRIVTGDGTFALKVSLSPDLDPRLLREAEVLKSLQKDDHLCDRIVRLHEIKHIGVRTCLRLTDAGLTLARVLADEGAQSIDYAKRWGEDLLRALEHLESHGVQHRDIKPGNLGVLSADQKRKRNLLLFDFSLSATDAADVRLGTPVYRDPFLAQRGRWDDAADRYAVAITLHELLTGERPRWGANDIATATSDEATLAAERFDATVRDRLVKFFRQALARDVQHRFPTAERMHAEWSACFASIPAPAPTGDEPAEDAPRSCLTAPLPEGLNLQTAVESLPLPARAKNGLYRAGVLQVSHLLRLPNNQLSAMRGVGRGTAREILKFIARPEFQDLRSQLPSSPAIELIPSGTGGDSPVRSLDAWVNDALPAVTKKSGEKALQHVRHLWGLDRVSGRHIDSVAELAATLGVSRPLLYQAVEKMCLRWQKLPFLDELKNAVHRLLESTGGYAPLANLGDGLALSLGCPVPLSPDDKRAQALVRIAVETHPLIRLARVDRRLWVIPADGDPSILEPLGKLADELALAEPLLSPGGALEQLRSLVKTTPLGAIADEPLVALAVAASKSAAKSARLEIYPRGLVPERALDLCLSALPPADLEPAKVALIVSARYPDAKPLPQGGALIDLLSARGYALDDAGKFCRRGWSLSPDATQVNPSRAHTTHTGHREKIDPEAREFARDIEVRGKRGSFCVLEVQPAFAKDAIGELEHRLSVQHISLEALLLSSMQTLMDENKVDPQTVYLADRAGPTGPDWPILKYLMEQAADRVFATLAAVTKPLVLSEPGLLARFGLSKFLKQLVEHVRKDESPAVFLLVPASEDAGEGIRVPHPDGDLPIPLTSPAQHLQVPQAWILNLDRGQRSGEFLP